MTTKSAAKKCGNERTTESDKSRGYSGTPRQGRKRAQGWMQTKEPTRRQAAAYVRLCHNPTKDLLSWLETTYRDKPYRAKIHQGQGEDNDQFSTNRAARQYVEFCKKPLQNLCGRLGQDGGKRSGSHCLSSRPRNSQGGFNGLQSLRVAGSRTIKGFKAAARATTGRGNLSRIFRKAATVKTHRRQNITATGGEALTVTPELDQGFINAVYEAELNRFAGAIAAAEADSTKPHAERVAAVKALRMQQQQAAAAARQAATEAEKARVKGIKEREKGSREGGKGGGITGRHRPKPS